jgi:hypothetical protein
LTRIGQYATSLVSSPIRLSSLLYTQTLQHQITKSLCLHPNAHITKARLLPSRKMAGTNASIFRIRSRLPHSPSASSWGRATVLLALLKFRSNSNMVAFREFLSGRRKLASRDGGGVGGIKIRSVDVPWIKARSRWNRLLKDSVDAAKIANLHRVTEEITRPAVPVSDYLLLAPICSRFIYL